MSACVVAIPIYQPELKPLERFSLDYSVARLQGRHLCFVAPKDLDVRYYERHFPGVAFEITDRSCRHVESKRLPVFTIIKRDKDCMFRPCK